MNDFFYGMPKWSIILIIVTVVLFVIGLSGYVLLG